jgi:hypothetical protein
MIPDYEPLVESGFEYLSVGGTLTKPAPASSTSGNGSGSVAVKSVKEAAK